MEIILSLLQARGEYVFALFDCGSVVRGSFGGHKGIIDILLHRHHRSRIVSGCLVRCKRIGRLVEVSGPLLNLPGVKVRLINIGSFFFGLELFEIHEVLKVEALLALLVGVQVDLDLEAEA